MCNMLQIIQNYLEKLSIKLISSIYKIKGQINNNKYKIIDTHEAYTLKIQNIEYKKWPKIKATK